MQIMFLDEYYLLFVKYKTPSDILEMCWEKAKVLILVQKAPNLARFKIDLEKKLKISKTIAELSIVLSFIFFKQ